MSGALGRFWLWLAGAVMLSLVASMPVHASVVSTDQALAQDHARQERERVKALLQRPEVARQMEKLGVAPQNAQQRVDAMSNEEVMRLAGKLDALPAGGLSNQEWLLVIIGILLLVIVL